MARRVIKLPSARAGLETGPPCPSLTYFANVYAGVLVVPRVARGNTPVVVGTRSRTKYPVTRDRRV